MSMAVQSVQLYYQWYQSGPLRSLECCNSDSITLCQQKHEYAHKARIMFVGDVIKRKGLNLIKIVLTFIKVFFNTLEDKRALEALLKC